MARGHGRILSSIWEDQDFLALTQQQQRLYLFLISQPNLNHAGLLPLTLRRWARKASGLTPAELQEHLADLADTGFIVLDEDTEELLIRSFVRNDGVWKQPKVMGAMVSGALEMESRALRRALLEEMNRIPLDELSDEPAKMRGGAGPSIRQQVREHIETLRTAFREPTPTPPAGTSEPPSETPSGTPSEPPSDSPTQGDRKGSTRAGAGAHDAQGRGRASRARSPAPTPVPYPTKNFSSGNAHTPGPGDAEAAQPPDDEPTPPPAREDVELICVTLADAIEANGSKRPTITKRWRTEARLLFDKDGRTVNQVLNAIAWCQADPFWRSNVLSMPKLRERYDQLRLAAQRSPQRQPSNVVALTSGQPLPGTDTTVAGWAAVAEQLRQEGDTA